MAIAVSALVMTADFRSAIGFSSFTVLLYYAVTNAAAWTLGSRERRWPRPYAAAGFLACSLLAFTLPVTTILAGIGVLAAGGLLYLISRRRGS